MKHNSSYLAILTGLALPLNAALVAEYDFSDGTLLDDTSGEGHDLTQTGTATLNADGYSVQLDDSEYLTATTLDNSSSAYTISLWFNPDVANPDTHSSIISSSGTDDWQIENVAGTGIRVNADAGQTSTMTTLGINTWYHVVFVTDGTGFDLYLTEDGNSLTNIASSTTGTYSMDDLRIGVNRGQNVNWEGDYASAVVYDEALDEASLSALLTSGPEAAAIPEPSSLLLLGLASLAGITRRKK